MSQTIERISGTRRARISGNGTGRLHYSGNRVSVEPVDGAALSGSLTLSIGGKLPVTLDLAADRCIGNSVGFDYLDFEVTGLPAGAVFMLVVGGV